MPDPDLKFRLPVKTEVSILAELYVKGSELAAGMNPPRSLESLLEEFILSLLHGGQHKPPLASWPRETEKRAGSPATKTETPKPN